jgi:cyclophilin family peptidyl-prolyl cis-trans isomerase
MPRLTLAARLALLGAAIFAPSASGVRMPVALAEDPPPLLAVPEMADRAKILATEMRRGPAADLAPYLKRAAHPTLRLLAIRALGRIGDRAGAPDLLKAGLKEGGVDLRQYLHAAGLSAAKSLEQEVLAHATSKDPAVAADALEALGWIGGDAAVGALGRALHRSEAAVLTAALEGLARAKAEGYLERVVRWFDHEDPAVRRAAAFATWMLAGARRTAVTGSGATWAGDAELAQKVQRSSGGWGGLGSVDSVRPLGVLGLLPQAGPYLLEALAAQRPSIPDEVAQFQEALARIYAPRTDLLGEDAMVWALGHPDPVTRQAAVEAIATKPRSEALRAKVKDAAAKEADARVREAYAITLAKLGDRGTADALLARPDRAGGPTLRFLTELRVLATSSKTDAGEPVVALALQHASRPAVLLEALSLLEDVPGLPAQRLVAACLSGDGYVRAAAVGLVGKHAMLDHLPALDAMQETPYTHAEGDVRQAIVEAWAELLKTEKVSGAQADALRKRIALAAGSDPSFTARAAACEAMKALKIDGAPSEDPLQPNDWKGLPRPKDPLFGFDFRGQGPMTEADILALADLMVEHAPEFVVETDVGAFRLAIDAREAPVHAVSFLLGVIDHVYEETPWHRVVPSFVIQGGDPHGTGNGDAGYHLPDEITRGRFVRGALGMPKGAIRDTGGCQLFVMHSDYRPLDGRYTCYGRVVDGMATVDKIRIGDRIRHIGMVQPVRAR